MWSRGEKRFKMSASQIDEVSSRLAALKPYIPSTFSRKPRGLEEPLSQVVKRIQEQQLQPVGEPLQNPHMVFLLDNQDCGEVIERNNESHLCRVFQHPEPLFMEPCDSTLIGAFCAHCRMYNIVEFPEEGLVGIVAHCWT